MSIELYICMYHSLLGIRRYCQTMFPWYVEWRSTKRLHDVIWWSVNISPNPFTRLASVNVGLCLTNMWELSLDEWCSRDIVRHNEQSDRSALFFLNLGIGWNPSIWPRENIDKGHNLSGSSWITELFLAMHDVLIWMGYNYSPEPWYFTSSKTCPHIHSFIIQRYQKNTDERAQTPVHRIQYVIVYQSSSSSSFPCIFDSRCFNYSLTNIAIQRIPYQPNSQQD